MTPLLLARDTGGFVTSGKYSAKAFSDTILYFSLVSGTVTKATIPNIGNQSMYGNNVVAEFSIVSASENAQVWVSPLASPAITLPTSTVTATRAELNPIARVLTGGQIIQLLTEQEDVVVSIACYCTQAATQGR